MHLAEPTLYWRIKLASGRWTYVRAKVLRSPFGEIYRVEYPKVVPDEREVGESERM